MSIEIDELDKMSENLKDIGKHIDRLQRDRTALLEALKELFAYIEDGTLVRNISNDANPGWAVGMLPFMLTLNKVKAAINLAEKESGL